MYFSDSYELRQLEKLMRAIPNFRSRGHGVMILHRYEYTERDCDCLACPHFISRKRGCGADKCPCIGERITAGAATLKETVAETMAAIKYPPFVERLIQYLKESEGNPMYFRNEKHRNGGHHPAERTAHKKGVTTWYKQQRLAHRRWSES